LDQDGRDSDLEKIPSQLGTLFWEYYSWVSLGPSLEVRERERRALRGIAFFGALGLLIPVSPREPPSAALGTLTLGKFKGELCPGAGSWNQDYITKKGNWLEEPHWKSVRGTHGYRNI